MIWDRGRDVNLEKMGSRHWENLVEGDNIPNCTSKQLFMGQYLCLEHHWDATHQECLHGYGVVGGIREDPKSSNPDFFSSFWVLVPPTGRMRTSCFIRSRFGAVCEFERPQCVVQGLVLQHFSLASLCAW